VFEEHPIFMIYNAPDSPFPDTVQIARWLQVTDDWKSTTPNEPTACGQSCDSRPANPSRLNIQSARAGY
jgi:hypothetical protein